MQRAWDTPKIAVCPDSGCACCSLKSQYPQIMMSPLFRKRGHFSSPILKKRQRNVRCIVEGFLKRNAKLVSPPPKLFQEIWDKTGKCVRWLSTTKGDISMDNILTVPIHLKMTLTAEKQRSTATSALTTSTVCSAAPTAPSSCSLGRKSWSSAGSLKSTSAKSW